ncbi:DUF1428 family protein [Roseomonas sp. JC162]|uniref:DUF1428 family protein n=1 Tax=Neoroseomonas marina TaxID=1232220 RepID=A0A848E781_9PROT|nr:DUF1428 family protein [Neoroseomonas marina]NMJ39966.1 DUF1428 family protein [Neoroseomonas marina]
MPYVDCYLIPVPEPKLEAYRRFSTEMAAVYREYGAGRIVDCLLDAGTADGAAFHADGAQADLAGTPLRDFRAAAAARTGEVVVVSWTEWPSKAVRDDALPRILADARVQPKDGEEAIFEGRRLVAGGFHMLIDQ